VSSGGPEKTNPSTLGDLESAEGRKGSAGFEALFDVSMPVVIEIGRTNLTVQEVLNLSVGSVVRLNRMVGEPVDVYVSDRRLAQGEIVIVGDHFGVRVTRVLSSAGLEAAA
jgi:flagellar motor switch protein FliN